MMNNDKVKQFSIDSLLYDKKLIGDNDSNKRMTTGCLEKNGRALEEESYAERKNLRVSKYANSIDDLSVNAFRRTPLVSAIFPTVSSTTVAAASHFLPRTQPPNGVKHIFPQYSPSAGIFGCGGVPLITPPIGLAFHLASTTAAAVYGRAQPPAFLGAAVQHHHQQNCRTTAATAPASFQQQQVWRPPGNGLRMVNGLPLLGGFFAAASQSQPPPTMPSTSSGSNAKKYKCDVCHKAFSRSNTLVTHKRIHTGEKPFLCDHCGRAFRQPGNLTRHRLTHTTVKPYTCQQCGKAFNRASNLHTHARTHNLYKPFICNICDKGFYQKVDLRLHVRTHIDKLDRSDVMKNI